MFTYIIKRFGWALLTLWAVVTLTFLLMHIIPGDPFAKEGNMPPAVYQNLVRYYHLDKPLIVQYGLYLEALLHFDFGPSLKSETQTVNDMIVQGFPVSLELGLQAIVVAVVFGVLFGVTAALFHNKWPDYVSMILAIVGISVPSFVLASLLINYLSVNNPIFPAAGWGTFMNTILPTIALAALPMAFIARLMRSSMLEVLNQDYIKTAKAKGLTRFIVILQHTIRNAILPVVSVLGIIAANTITGSFVVERIFAIPGLGDLFVKGIFNRDYPVILGSTVFYSAILIFLIFIVDIAYTWVDPRIKLTGGNK
ncbi:ABC transporter permease [Aneurinibacillus tyrosinisolvens]|uniref:ABC transporter permease n=1 Tax=Aneurinibacillus tyrosinisolvens TaxID=1443435 RepID=UPI00063FC4DA|nr:ABC transporter permease [Aneurinibacillus tyrosinisolvens]